MKLLTLVLRNFKGIKNLELIANGGNVSVFGDNATGKTTVADAFSWLLFDKDSQNKKDFQLKTLTESGEAIHNLEHEVEGTLQLDNRTVTLKKVYKEKWTQKRGSVSQEFTGHTTDYYIDGVPVPKKDYDKLISEIAPEDVFKLLTNPAFFNEQLHWQERRKTLLDICGDISDEEVINSDKSLEALPSILQGRKLDDHRKVIAAQQAAINKDLKEIPARIDEVRKSLPEDGLTGKEVLQNEIRSLKSQQEGKRQEIARIQNGSQVAEQQKALSQVETKLIDIKNRFKSEYGDKVHAKKMQVNDLRMKLQAVENKLSVNASDIQKHQAEIKRCDMSRETLRNRWHEINAREFRFEQDDTCPTCGQFLPDEQIASARQKALEQFNLKKSSELKSINAEGKRFKERTAELQSTIEKLQGEIETYTTEKEQVEQAVSSLQAEIDSMNNPSIENDQEYLKIVNEKTAIQAKIAELNSENQAIIRNIQSEIDVLNTDISSRERSIAQIDQAENAHKRIKELEAKEKELSAEYERLQGELFLTEQFIRAKVSMLEERINSRFKFARFKLFDVQVNGGVNECCETLFKGVPYGSGLNNAAKINVGLDIINTLSEHYSFTAPIFVDNAESVTKLIETKAQVISLIVSAADKVLRVEYEDQENLFKEAV